MSAINREAPAACAVPPPGWYCTRPAGHDGPCAAHPGVPEEPASATPSSKDAGGEPMYQAQFDGEYGSSVWRDVTEAAYHTFLEKHRRIVYAAPVHVAAAPSAEQANTITIDGRTYTAAEIKGRILQLIADLEQANKMLANAGREIEAAYEAGAAAKTEQAPGSIPEFPDNSASAAGAGSEQPGADADELHIGMSNNDQGVHINIIQRHADHTSTAIFTAKVPPGDSYARITLAQQAAPEAPATTASASDGSIYETVSRRFDPKGHAETIAQLDGVLGRAADGQQGASRAALTDAQYQEVLSPVLSRYGMQRYLNGDSITLDPSDYRAIIDRAALARAPLPAQADKLCTLPPEGWHCTRAAGHEGPCAAWPEGGGV